MFVKNRKLKKLWWPLKEQNRVYSCQITGVGVSKLFHKGLDSKIISGVVGSTVSAAPVWLSPAAQKRPWIIYINKWVWLSSNQTLFINVKFEFDVFFVSSKIFLDCVPFKDSGLDLVHNLLTSASENKGRRLRKLSNFS